MTDMRGAQRMTARGSPGLTSFIEGKAYAWRETNAVARIAIVNFIAVCDGGIRVDSVDLRADILGVLEKDFILLFAKNYGLPCPFRYEVQT